MKQTSLYLLIETYVYLSLTIQGIYVLTRLLLDLHHALKKKPPNNDRLNQTLNHTSAIITAIMLMPVMNIVSVYWYLKKKKK